MAIQKVRREFEIDIDMTKPISNFERFRQSLEAIRYAARQAFQHSVQDEPGEPAMGVPSGDHEAIGETVDSKPAPAAS